MASSDKAVLPTDQQKMDELKKNIMEAQTQSWMLAEKVKKWEFELQVLEIEAARLTRVRGGCPAASWGHYPCSLNVKPCKHRRRTLIVDCSYHHKHLVWNTSENNRTVVLDDMMIGKWETENDGDMKCTFPSGATLIIPQVIRNSVQGL